MTDPQPTSPTDWRTRCTKNDNGEWIKTEKTVSWGGNTHSYEVNMTKLLEVAGPRTTGNEFILRVEHENLIEGKDVGNPAEPTTGEAIPAAVREQIRGLQSIDEVMRFIQAEVDRGPRQYVIALANERKIELGRDGE